MKEEDISREIALKCEHDWTNFKMHQPSTINIRYLYTPKL